MGIRRAADILVGDLADGVGKPVDLSIAHRPLRTQNRQTFSLSQARRQASDDDLFTFLGSPGLGRLWRVCVMGGASSLAVLLS
jgi:hypothetical protein